MTAIALARRQSDSRIAYPRQRGDSFRSPVRSVGDSVQGRTGDGDDADGRSYVQRIDKSVGTDP